MVVVVVVVVAVVVVVVVAAVTLAYLRPGDDDILQTLANKRSGSC